MLGCSQQPDLPDDSNQVCRPRHRRRRLSKVSRNSTHGVRDDSYKSISAYGMWDQWQLIRHWRHAAWALLRDHYVVSAVWLDEVLAYHGSEIPLGDYCLVVHDVQGAAEILALYGYGPVGWEEDYSILNRLHCQRIKMSAPGAIVDVILLSAQEWCYDLSRDALHNELCPYLPEFIDSMMELWLKVPTRSYNANGHLMQFLESVVHECYRLNDFGDGVCENGYAVWLMPHHREIHFDIVARSKGLTKRNLDHQPRHQYHVHKANLIRHGKFEPRPKRKKTFNPRLPSLREAPEDTKSTPKGLQGPVFVASTSIKTFPASMDIGIAL